jgi:hypothetical protein
VTKGAPRALLNRLSNSVPDWYRRRRAPGRNYGANSTLELLDGDADPTGGISKRGSPRPRIEERLRGVFPWHLQHDDVGIEFANYARQSLTERALKSLGVERSAASGFSTNGRSGGH